MRSGRLAWTVAAVLLLTPSRGALSVYARHSGASPSGEQTREVVFAGPQNHRLQVFDAGTLEPVGEIAGLHNLLQHVSVSPDGRTAFLAQAATVDGDVCCTLFELSLVTGEMCRLIDPAADSRLYGLDGGGPASASDRSQRLVALDPLTGAVVAERTLTPDVRRLAVATVPASVLPLGALHPTACRSARPRT